MLGDGQEAFWACLIGYSCDSSGDVEYQSRGVAACTRSWFQGFQDDVPPARQALPQLEGPWRVFEPHHPSNSAGMLLWHPRGHSTLLSPPPRKSNPAHLSLGCRSQSGFLHIVSGTMFSELPASRNTSEVIETTRPGISSARMMLLAMKEGLGLELVP